MAVQNFPFDSISIDNPDRAADSAQLADYIGSFFSDGVLPPLVNYPNMHQLAVRASSPVGMSVQVDTGMGIIKGRKYYQDAVRTLNIASAEPTLSRKDRIVLRMNLNQEYRNNDLYVVKGTASLTPAAPELTRNNVVYELSLATVNVRAGVTSITGADIQDERYNNAVCGFVYVLLGEVDTSVINATLQSFYENMVNDTENWQTGQKTQFETWFAGIRGILDGDVAGNLLNKIEQKIQVIDSYTLRTGAWVSMGGKFQAKIGNVQIKAGTLAEVLFKADSIDAASEAGIDYEVTTEAGNIVLTAGSIPSKDLTCTVILYQEVGPI